MIKVVEMGLFDAFKKKEEQKAEEKPLSEMTEAERQKAFAEREEKREGKYDEACSACGGRGTDKKWMGQYWHKKCLRASKRQAKGMI